MRHRYDGVIVDALGILNVQFMGKLIETVNYHDNHLGFPIGNVNQQDVISHAVNQFTMRVNMVVSHF